MIASLAPALAGPVTAVTEGFGPGRGHHGGGFFWLGPVFALFWIALVGLAVAFLLRRSGRGPGSRWSGGPGSAEAVLHERYARGEIDVEDYQARLEVLRRARKG